MPWLSGVAPAAARVAQVLQDPAASSVRVHLLQNCLHIETTVVLTGGVIAEVTYCTEPPTHPFLLLLQVRAILRWSPTWPRTRGPSDVPATAGWIRNAFTSVTWISSGSTHLGERERSFLRGVALLLSK